MNKYIISKKEDWFCYKIGEFNLEEPFQIEVPIDSGCREIIIIGDEIQLPQSSGTYIYDKDFVKENKGKKVSIFSIRSTIKLPFGSGKVNDFIESARSEYFIKFSSLFNYACANPSLVESKDDLRRKIKTEIISFLTNLTEDMIANFEVDLNNTIQNFLYTQGLSLQGPLTLIINR